MPRKPCSGTLASARRSTNLGQATLDAQGMTTMTIDRAIRSAGNEDHDEVAATVAAEFFYDTVTCWLLPRLRP